MYNVFTKFKNLIAIPEMIIHSCYTRNREKKYKYNSYVYQNQKIKTDIGSKLLKFILFQIKQKTQSKMLRKN